MLPIEWSLKFPNS